MKKLLLIAGLLLVVGLMRVRAHAHLERSDPPANAALTAAPEAIRLWFTEPLEPAFSRVSLRDSQGEVVQTPPSAVAPDDRYQLVLPLEPLPDGLYTVVWRVVSGADGHPTEGSFAFGINVAVSASDAAAAINENIPPESIAIRGFNLLALSLLIGSLGFRLFVWRPRQIEDSSVNRAHAAMILVGWVLVGAASVLLLMLQTSATAAIPFWQTLTDPALGDVLTRTTYGSLWIARVQLWALLGVALLWSRRRGHRAWLGLLIGAALLLTQRMFGHASASQDAAAAIAGDWLHLLATTLWVGGLFAFLLTLIAERLTRGAAFTADLVGRFSNYARVAVGLLIVSGLYAAWLHIGSIDALLTTRYGQVLVVKLLLFLPLLALAGVNLVWTQRRLQMGHALWEGRLRGLIGAEIMLAAGVLVTAAMLTSGSPARGIVALRAVTLPDVTPISEMGYSAEQMIHLDISPGYAGENVFIVMPYDAEGSPIADVSLIRLRFDNLDQNLGQSELRPVALGDGIYSATGANLSIPGRWRIRMTIQRPGQFDMVTDFEVQASPPPFPQPPDIAIPLPQRLAAALLTGLGLLVTGGFALAAGRQGGSRALGVAALIVGIVFLLTAAAAFSQGGTLPG